MKQVSIREFAKKMKCAESSIRKAIDNGIIKEGYDLKNKLINFDIAKKEWKNRAAAAAKKDDKSERSKTVNTKISLGEATRLHKIFEAKKKELEVAELEGILVRKDHVYKELFQAGLEVRAALQMIPDKFIDNILATKDRNESHKILSDAIVEALQGLHFKNVKI